MTDRLHAAIEAEDWDNVVQMVETEWPVLLAIAVPALDAALQALPASSWAEHPTAAVVRDIRLNVRGDTSELDRLAMTTPLPSQAADIRRAARSKFAQQKMSAAAAFMIAYRVHGQFRKALHFATITEELARHARVSQPRQILIRVPSALLQIGITRLLAGDYHRASLVLREAYEVRNETWDGRVGGDAAGKLALLHAVRGETVDAERWLSRHDSSGALGWMVPLVQLSAKVAAVLIAVEKLDRDAAESTLRELEVQVNRERSWAPFVTYAHARYDLLWGDPRAALQRIDRTRAFTGADHRNAGIESRLDAVKADLLLSVGRSTEAQALVAQRQDSPHITAVSARMALLAGRASSAHELLAAGLSIPELDPCTQIDLLVTAAIADESVEAGRRYLQQAIAAASRSGSYFSFALAHRSSLEELVSSMGSPDRGWISSKLSLAPEPLPPAIDLVELTATEQRILDLMAEGRSRPGMAQALFVSENTVKFHVRNVHRKLGTNSREGALARARLLGLYQPTSA